MPEASSELATFPTLLSTTTLSSTTRSAAPRKPAAATCEDDDAALPLMGSGAGDEETEELAHSHIRKCLPELTSTNVGEAPAADPTWCSGDEDTDEWDNELRKYGKQWLTLVLLYCTAPGLAFSYSIVKSISYGSWWNTSGDEPYEPWPADRSKYLTAYITLPAILKTHMVFAVPMLLAILAQLLMAYLYVFRNNLKALRMHKRFGIVPITIVMGCVFLGTVALWRCDVNPKRGAENVFFVWIGVFIIFSMVQSVRYASRGRVGLHMQYMAICICLVFSPGYNRIATVLIRLYFSLREPDYSHACWSANTWNDLGYYYTWSFIMGSVVMLLLWLLPRSPAKAPFFKIWSLGFWFFLLLAVIMMACLWQIFFEWQWDTYTKFAFGLDCSKKSLSHWEDFANAQRANGLYAGTTGYGLCAPDHPHDLPGVPVAVAHNPKVLRASGIWDVSN